MMVLFFAHMLLSINAFCSDRQQEYYLPDTYDSCYASMGNATVLKTFKELCKNPNAKGVSSNDIELLDSLGVEATQEIIALKCKSFSDKQLSACIQAARAVEINFLAEMLEEYNRTRRHAHRNGNAGNSMGNNSKNPVHVDLSNYLYDASIFKSIVQEYELQSSAIHDENKDPIATYQDLMGYIRASLQRSYALKGSPNCVQPEATLLLTRFVVLKDSHVLANFLEELCWNEGTVLPTSLILKGLASQNKKAFACAALKDYNHYCIMPKITGQGCGGRTKNVLNEIKMSFGDATTSYIWVRRGNIIAVKEYIKLPSLSHAFKIGDEYGVALPSEASFFAVSPDTKVLATYSQKVNGIIAVYDPFSETNDTKFVMHIKPGETVKDALFLSPTILMIALVRNSVLHNYVLDIAQKKIVPVSLSSNILRFTFGGELEFKNQYICAGFGDAQDTSVLKNGNLTADEIRSLILNSLHTIQIVTLDYSFARNF